MISLQLISCYWPFKFSLNSLMTILLKKEAGDIVKTLFCQYSPCTCERVRQQPSLTQDGAHLGSLGGQVSQGQVR